MTTEIVTPLIDTINSLLNSDDSYEDKIKLLRLKAEQTTGKDHEIVLSMMHEYIEEQSGDEYHFTLNHPSGF